jgi:hypothetical protein
MTAIKVHWNNPWNDAIPVPIEELAECYEGLGKSCLDSRDNSTFIWTVEKVLAHWRQKPTEKLDAYVLLCPSGMHCMGIRYGNKDSQYLSPAGDPKKLEALAKKYQ